MTKQELEHELRKDTDIHQFEDGTRERKEEVVPVPVKNGFSLSKRVSGVYRPDY